MESARLYDYHPDFQFNFCSDGIAVFKNIDFFWDTEFQRGYKRAVRSAGVDHGIQWRFLTCLWAAKNALRLEGDFVECGVGRGIMSSGLMEILDWNALNREFYLLDTFSGVVEELCTEAEIEKFTREDGGVKGHNEAFEGFYAESYESVRKNFQEWSNVTFVKGAVPHSLKDLEIDKVAYLHIDMNSVIPEMEAINFFWPRLSIGSCVVLDDYAFPDYELQYGAWNEWGRSNNVAILTIPTGQGLIIKT